MQTRPDVPWRQRQHHNTDVAPLVLRLTKPRAFRRVQRNRMCGKDYLLTPTTVNMSHNNVYWFGVTALTLLFCCLIEKKFQTIGWNSEGDSCSDLHGVYTNDFTILIGAEINTLSYKQSPVAHNVPRHSSDTDQFGRKLTKLIRGPPEFPNCETNQ